MTGIYDQNDPTDRDSILEYMDNMQEATVAQTLRFIYENPVFGCSTVQRYFTIRHAAAQRWIGAWLRCGFIVKDAPPNYRVVFRKDKK